MTSTPQEYFNKVQAIKRQGKSAATKYISFDAATPSLQQPDRCPSYRHSITSCRIADTLLVRQPLFKRVGEDVKVSRLLAGNNLRLARRPGTNRL